MSDTFRKEYKPLTEDQKEHVNVVKNTAGLLLDAFNNAIDPEERSERSRCMAVAKTQLETAIMWAVKGITFVEENK